MFMSIYYYSSLRRGHPEIQAPSWVKGSVGTAYLQLKLTKDLRGFPQSLVRPLRPQHRINMEKALLAPLH